MPYTIIALPTEVSNLFQETTATEVQARLQAQRLIARGIHVIVTDDSGTVLAGIDEPESGASQLQAA